MKHYSVVDVNGRAMIVFDGKALLDNIYIHANLNRYYSRDCFLSGIKQTDNEIIIGFADVLIPTLTVTLKEYDGVLQFTIDAQLKEFNNGFGAYFTSDRGIVLHYRLCPENKGCLSSSPWWDRFWRHTALKKIFPNCRSLLKAYYCL